MDPTGNEARPLLHFAIRRNEMRSLGHRALRATEHAGQTAPTGISVKDYAIERVEAIEETSGFGRWWLRFVAIALPLHMRVHSAHFLSASRSLLGLRRGSC